MTESRGGWSAGRALGEEREADPCATCRDSGGFFYGRPSRVLWTNFTECPPPR